MRIAIIASPFISVPPVRYGGTELFIAHLAEGLERRGVEAVVYCNAESTVNAERQSCYPRAEWPLSTETSGMLKELDHMSWSIEHADGTGQLWSLFGKYFKYRGLVTPIWGLNARLESDR